MMSNMSFFLIQLWRTTCHPHNYQKKKNKGPNSSSLVTTPDPSGLSLAIRSDSSDLGLAIMHVRSKCHGSGIKSDPNDLGLTTNTIIEEKYHGGVWACVCVYVYIIRVFC
jgi:MOSC domain-containing protein YiiM